MAKAPNIVSTAKLRNIRCSPRKARLIIDLIKGKQVDQALQILDFSPRRASKLTSRLLKSAIANARENSAADVDKLWVVGGRVNMGTVMKRFTPRAQGRATPIRKRFAHIELEVGNW